MCRECPPIPFPIANDDMSYQRSEKHWQNSKSQTYLHQWQFALKNDRDAPQVVESVVAHECGVGTRHHRKGHVRLLRQQGQRRVQSMQYIFMGNESTGTHLHRDNGGLAISRCCGR